MDSVEVRTVPSVSAAWVVTSLRVDTPFWVVTEAGESAGVGGGGGGGVSRRQPGTQTAGSSCGDSTRHSYTAFKHPHYDPQLRKPHRAAAPPQPASKNGRPRAIGAESQAGRAGGEV